MSDRRTSALYSHREPRTPPRHLLAAPWQTIEAGPEGSVLVTVAGDISSDRSHDLWASVEEALELANGGLTIVDLTKVTGFDIGNVGDLIRIAKDSIRRSLDLCALIRPHSSLGHYAHYSGLEQLLPIYACTAAALGNTHHEFPDTELVVGTS